MAKKRVKGKTPALQSKEYLFMSDLSFLLMFRSLSEIHTHNKHSEMFCQHQLPLFHSNGKQNFLKKKRKNVPSLHH